MVSVFRQIAERRGCTLAQVALAWLLLQSVVSIVIVGAKWVEQLRENVAATEVRLEPDDLAALDAVSGYRSSI